MPLEIEVKLKVESLDAVRETLRRLGARRLGYVLETNLFFDRPDRSLLAANSGLRIRTERSLEGDGGGEHEGLLTYKGPPLATPLAPREAFDVKVVPVEQVVALVEALGFVRTLSYDKRRESWMLAGCRIELDELPVMGTFVEVEGPSEEIVVEVQGKLGLGGLGRVKESYVHMIDAHVRSRGQGTHVGFGDK